MGGRFGKYGDIKRRRALQRAGKVKSKLERVKKTSRRHRRSLLPPQTKIRIKNEKQIQP